MIYIGTIIFYIYINNLPDKLVSSLKFFADDISLFLQSTILILQEIYLIYLLKK